MEELLILLGQQHSNTRPMINPLTINGAIGRPQQGFGLPIPVAEADNITMELLRAHDLDLAISDVHTLAAYEAENQI